MAEEKKVHEKVALKKTCGIIMPIAPHIDYPADHWKDVLNILVEAIGQTEFEAKLVSDDVAIGLIHERIVNNVYNNEIIVCDVSSKNPNVMFELGLRLAFDKPTIIIKDENTGYSFDTGGIEHLSYPSSLRFNQIVKFKDELVKRINATYKKSISEANFSPFLKSFGKTIVPASIQQTEIQEGKFIINQLEELRTEIFRLRNDRITGVPNYTSDRNGNLLTEKQRRMMINDAIASRLADLPPAEKDASEKTLSIILDDLAKKGIKAPTAEVFELLLRFFERAGHS